MVLQKHLKLIAIVACSLAMAGCGPSSPKTVPAKGKITWQGQPIKQGTITFMPSESQSSTSETPRRAAIGQIQPDGTYRLSTFAKYDGILPGEYLVAITDQSDAPLEALPGQPTQPTASILPQPYAVPQSSGLSLTVPADAKSVETNFDLPLKTAP